MFCIGKIFQPGTILPNKKFVLGTNTLAYNGPNKLKGTLLASLFSLVWYCQTEKSRFWTNTLAYNKPVFHWQAFLIWSDIIKLKTLFWTNTPAYNRPNKPKVVSQKSLFNLVWLIFANWKTCFLDKHSSLFVRSLIDGEEKKSFIRLTPVANVIKLFTAVSYDFS